MMVFAYWPVFVGYFVFKLTKLVITNLHKMVVPTFVSLLVWFNCWFPSLPGMEGVNLLVLKKLLVKEEWIALLDLSSRQSKNTMLIILNSVIVIIFLLTIYILPALFGSQLVARFTENNLCEGLNWDGVDRAFHRIFEGLKEKNETKSSSAKVVSIVISLICLGMLGVIIYFMPSWMEAGMQAFNAWVSA